jgi:hypothetical protein
MTPQNYGSWKTVGGGFIMKWGNSKLKMLILCRIREAAYPSMGRVSTCLISMGQSRDPSTEQCACKMGHDILSVDPTNDNFH